MDGTLVGKPATGSDRMRVNDQSEQIFTFEALEIRALKPGKRATGVGKFGHKRGEGEP